MSARDTAYRRAGWLRYAAAQFVVLTGSAMVLYAGGTWFDPTASRYRFTENFLSDLGMTRAFSGHGNYASSALFALALASLGVATIAFAWCWRGFAFAAERARGAGHVSAGVGTASGLAFIGVAVTPFDRALTAHNTLVVAAFGLLLVYVAALSFVMWRNDVRGARFIANLCYLALVAGYVATVVLGPRFDTERGHTVQVVAQKTIVYASMLHVFFLATATRRALREVSNRKL